MLASHYPEIRLLHIGCVAFSGTLFTVRGAMRIADIGVANHWTLRWASYTVDSLLLLAAMLLTLIVHQYPFVNGWLTTKVLLLPLYIALGLIALKHARTPAGRLAAYLAALLTFGVIFGVAVEHAPGGWLRLLR